MTRKLSIAAALFVLLTIAPVVVASAQPDNPNDPAYWEQPGRWEHPVDVCYKSEGEPTWFGRLVADENGEFTGVELYPFDLTWDTPADHWEGFVFKYGTERLVIQHPEPGTYYTSTGQEVSHWIVCKGLSVTTTTIPPTTTTTTPSTTTSSTTTTTPTTTTTVTTAPPSTTTTTVPPTTSTSSPPTTSTSTTSSTTSTTVPPTTPTIDVKVCINTEQIDTSGTGAREPVVTYWSGNYQDFPDVEWDIAIVVYRDGEPVGSLEPVVPPTYGQHENWFASNVPIDQGVITAEVWINGELVAESTDCSNPPATTITVVVDPPPKTPTGVPTGNGGNLPRTGLPTGLLLLAGLVIAAVGGGLVIASKEE